MNNAGQFQDFKFHHALTQHWMSLRVDSQRIMRVWSSTASCLSVTRCNNKNQLSNLKCYT
eukprot:11214883-Ditylum_brightwellii.AAC.1